MLITTKEQLDRLIKEKESIYLYGAGNWGLAIVDYIVKNGNKNKIAGIFVSDLNGNMIEYEGIAIQRYETGICKGKMVLVCMVNSADICRMLETEGAVSITFETLSFLPNNPDNLKEETQKFSGLDFVVAGFAKCGTTTLHAVMMKNRSICLAEGKETFFYLFRDNFDNSMDILGEKFHITERHQMVGCVDPTFFSHAKDLYKDFGKELKVILIMRNPVKAVFSQFCMSLRDGRRIEGYKEYPRYSKEMFDIYCERILNNNCPHYYDRWVEEFIDVFGKENIHIVFFEELLKEPAIIMNKIYDFLGGNAKWHYDNLPKENEGKWVPATREGMLLANERRRLREESIRCQDKEILLSDEYKSINEQWEQMPRIINPTMTEHQKDKLEKMFSKSVRNLEKIVDRDLSVLWF